MVTTLASAKNYYLKFERDAGQYTDKILKAVSKSSLSKVVIASGPGTGKSYIFEKICSLTGRSNNLTLSFINELIDDLNKDIGHISTVQTLHSFTLGHIHGHQKYYLGLEDVVSKDYEIVFGKKINFKKILCDLIDDPNAIKFFFDRRQYYDHYSPNSSVYQLVKRFQNDKTLIPSYSQILIDEYQDFNKLEATLIDLLAEKSPTVLVGDDDQSLYGWKFANPEFIRTKCSSPDFEKLDLPYCFRCPKVIIEAYNSLIVYFKNKKLFPSDRVEKKYQYLPREDKDVISKLHNKISLTRKVFKPHNIAFVLDTQIKQLINQKDKQKPSVLIIFPNQLKKLIPILERYLRRKGYKYIDSPFVDKKEKIINAVNKLLTDGNSVCNLSWRLIVEEIFSETTLHNGVKKSYLDKGMGNFLTYLTTKERATVKKIRSGLIKIKKNLELSEQEQELIFSKLDYDPVKTTYKQLINDLTYSDFQIKNTHGDVPIKITTIMGSKGLSYDFVFLVNFDDKFVFKDGIITEQSICELLVAMTRARMKLSIITSTGAVPNYIKWANPQNFQEIV